MIDSSTRVLLVEDMESDYLLTRFLLSSIEGRKFNLDWKSSYEMGLDAILQGGYDVCLADYALGERDGVQLIEEARTAGAKIPIILLTGCTDYRVDIQAMRAGSADFLPKDQVTPALLERSIRYAIERSRSMAALEDGSELPVELSLGSMGTCEGSFLTGAVRNVSERRRGGDGHLKVDAAGTVSSASRPSVAGMSHELRTSLNAIIGFANLLLKNKSGNLLERDIDFLQRILRNAKDQLRLISSLPDLSLMDAGNGDVKLSQNSLHPLTQENVQQIEACDKR
jgi:DNA-binding response OmpR family regulator